MGNQTKYQFLQRKKGKKPKVSRPRPPRTEENRKRNCEICNAECDSIHLLKLHVKEVHGDVGEVSCLTCGKVYPKIEKLRKHIRMMHDDKMGPHNCDVCNKSCSTATILRKHKMSHAIIKPFACTKCDYKATRSDNVRQHMKKKHKMHDLPINKDVVKKVYIPPKKLEEMKMMRTYNLQGVDFFECLKCSKVYPTPRKLKKHYRQTHEDSHGPQVCSFCGKQFQTSTTFRKHMLCHSSVKPFACALCNFKGTRSDNVRQHVRKTHKRENTENCVIRVSHHDFGQTITHKPQKPRIKKDVIVSVVDENGTQLKQEELNLVHYTVVDADGVETSYNINGEQVMPSTSSVIVQQ